MGDDIARSVREGESTTTGLERWEAVAILFQLVVGDIETTVGLIAASVQHAAQTPDAWSNLREEPDSVGAFIEEALRLVGSAIGNLRRTTRPTELAGVALPAGSTLALLWGSANRDEAEFPDADRFVLYRPNIRAHLGFAGRKCKAPFAPGERHDVQ